MRLGEHQRSVLNPENPKKRSWSFAKGPGISVWSSNPATWNRWRPAPVLGVDIGENNRAATSTGKVFGGGALRHKRDCHLALRRRLRSHGSQSARQKLRQVSGKEAQRIRHIDHKTNKAIVAEAGRIGARKIVMKDMRHIRSRIKAGKCMRAKLHRWVWRQLQTLVEYEAKAAGIAVEYVHPAYTSQDMLGIWSSRPKNRASFRVRTLGSPGAQRPEWKSQPCPDWRDGRLAKDCRGPASCRGWAELRLTIKPLTSLRGCLRKAGALRASLR